MAGRLASAWEKRAEREDTRLQALARQLAAIGPMAVLARGFSYADAHVFVAGGTGLAPDEFLRLLAERGVLGMERDTTRVRFVTHRLIGDAEISRAAELVAALASEHAPTP